MSKGKKVKPTQPPSFQEPISLETIGKFIKARRTQQGLNTLDCAMLCNISAHTLNKIERKTMQKQQIKNILKDCFWEYNFNENDIILLAKSQDRQEQMFLFTKILENAKELLKSMKIFDESDLKRLIESYTLPSFKHDYMARRLNIVEYFFLDKPLTINELKWVA